MPQGKLSERKNNERSDVENRKFTGETRHQYAQLPQRSKGEKDKFINFEQKKSLKTKDNIAGQDVDEISSPVKRRGGP